MTARIAGSCAARPPCGRRRSRLTGGPSPDRSALRRWVSSKLTAGAMHWPGDLRAAGRGCAAATSVVDRSADSTGSRVLAGPSSATGSLGIAPIKEE